MLPTFEKAVKRMKALRAKRDAIGDPNKSGASGDVAARAAMAHSCRFDLEVKLNSELHYSPSVLM